MAVDLASEFAPPAAPVAPTATTNRSVDLMSEFSPPPREEQYAVSNDATDKAHQWKTADSTGRLKLLMENFGEHFSDETRKTIETSWKDINSPLVEVPEAPRGSYQAAVYNGLAPIASSLTTPLNLGTLGMFGALTKVAQGIGPAAAAARHGLTVIKTAFAAQMAKGAGEAAGAASVTEGKSPQQTTEEVTSALAQSALAALAGHSAIADVVAPEPAIKAPAVNSNAVSEAIGRQTDAAIANTDATLASIPERPKLAEEFKAPEKVLDRGVSEQAKVDLEKLDNVPLKEGEKVDIGDRSGRPTGAAEDAIVAEQKRLIDEHLAKQPKLAEEFTPPAEPQTVPEKIPVSSPTAVMNAIVDQERAKRGLPPAMEPEARTDKAAWDAAIKELDQEPQAAANLVAKLKENPAAVNDIETALIRHRQITLQNSFDRVAGDIVKAAESGDTEAVARLGAERDRLSNELKDVYDVGKLVGTETGRGLRARRVLANEDFTLAQMVTRRRAANDGLKLTEEQMAETQALHEKISATQKAFDDYVKQVEERMAKLEKPQAGTRNTSRNVVSSFIDRQAEAARQRIKARLAEGRVQSGLDPADLADHAIVGAQHLKNGIAEFGAWSAEMVKEFGERVKPHLQAIFDKAKEELKAAEDRKEEIRLKSFKTRAENLTEELTQKTAAGDFTPKPRPAPLQLDPEGLALKAKLDVAKEEYANALERDRVKNLRGLARLKETAMHSYDMARLIMTTGEFSFILRQGKIGALSHPIITAKAIPNAMRALIASPEAAHAINLEIANHPDIAAARAAKLFLIEKGHSLSKQEEFLMAKWADRVPIVGRFNQAAEVFLNKLRFDMWRAMRGTGGLTPAQDRQVAMFVNEATGRGGLGKLEAAALPLGRIMFSPRFFASRLQLLTGHSMWGGDLATRRIIATEYARALVGLSAYYGLLYLGFKGLSDKEPDIGTDPRSSDFGKVKLGNTRVDPLAGMAQTIVFGARTGLVSTNAALGTKIPESVTLGGKPINLRSPDSKYGGQSWVDVAASFGRSKLHPVPGNIVNLFKGTDLGGNPVTPASALMNTAYPITYMDIYQALEEQNLPTGMALGLLATLGEGMQTFNKKGKVAPMIEPPAQSSPPPARR